MKRKQVSRPTRKRVLSQAFMGVLYYATLAGACLLLYAHTTSFGYTELDDTIFIRELESYTRADSCMQSFRRGVFSDTADTYYRPLLLNSFVWDRHREGARSSFLHHQDARVDNISQYHWTNIFLHIISVLLVFVLLRRVLKEDTQAFLLAMIFAVHPALSQAVSWIPGRNDTLLAVFTLSFLLCVLEYVRTKSTGFLMAQPLLLLGALFTKETGIVAAVVAFVLLLTVQNELVTKRHYLILVSVWLAALAMWVFFRSGATVKNQDLTFSVLAASFVERLPLAVQYFGKIILPFNLSVFPWQEDTTIWFGVVAIFMVGAGIALAKQRNWKVVLAGTVWYAAFLLPALIVPKSINREAFEHRLYLPMLGILILMTQTSFLQRLKGRSLLFTGLSVCALLGVYNYSRSSVFSNKFAFWESAVATTPSSAYAKMMLGARYYRDPVAPRKEDGIRLLTEAYQLDSTQKYLNYYLGSVMMDRGDWTKMEEYLERESAQDQPIQIEMYSNRARGFIERKMPTYAEPFLLKWREKAPLDQSVNTNLLLFYLNESPRPEMARAQMQYMTKNGIPIPQPLLQASESAPTGNNSESN